MGMTIDNYIKIIKNWLYKGTDGLTNTKLGYMEGWFHKTDKEAFETAIAIMRKYQKIADLYDYWRSSKCEYTISCMENIGKVLKDG